MVRRLIGDNKKVANNENIGEGDGVNTTFMLDMFPMTSGATSVLAMFLTGVTAATNSYTISGALGRVTFSAAPANGATILASYMYYALTSGELSEILSGHSGQPYLAASRACMALAADASRHYAYTMGDKTIDKRRVAPTLIEMSKQYENMHYRGADREGYTGTVMTFKDNSGTEYYDYDAGRSIYPSTGINY